MCLQCVSTSAPYVLGAVGGLRMMGWRAARARVPARPVELEHGEEGDSESDGDKSTLVH